MVILDRTLYDNSIINIISDSSNFKHLKADPTITRECKLQRFLRAVKKNGQITGEIYDYLYPTGSQPARIYSLPKMHKTRAPSSAPPFGAMVSSIGTYNYNLAKHLCSLLVPFIPQHYSTQDNFFFVNEIT